MARVKNVKVTRARRKKILKLAKGFWGSKRTLYRTAHEQVMRSLAYSYRDRKQRKREFRKLWIARINAGAKLNGIKYSTLIHGLSLAGVSVNRKMLAEIAIHEPKDFKAYCDLAVNAINGNNTPNNASKPAMKETVDYSAMKVADLKELAKEKGIENSSSLKKDELIAALLK